MASGRTLPRPRPPRHRPDRVPEGGGSNSQLSFLQEAKKEFEENNNVISKEEILGAISAMSVMDVVDLH